MVDVIIGQDDKCAAYFMQLQLMYMQLFILTYIFNLEYLQYIYYQKTTLNSSYMKFFFGFFLT